MAARKKPEDQKYSCAVTLRMTQQMHDAIDAYCRKTGQSMSEIMRDCFDKVLASQRRK